MLRNKTTGQWLPGHSMPMNWRKKIAQAHRGKSHPDFGIQWRKKISNTHKRRWKVMRDYLMVARRKASLTMKKKGYPAHFRKFRDSHTNFSQYCSERTKSLWKSPGFRAKYRLSRMKSRQKSGGYYWVYKPLHPYCNSRGYVPEHRWVVEQVTGKLLEKTHIVHHLDGNRLNNDLENLVIMTVS